MSETQMIDDPAKAKEESAAYMERLQERFRELVEWAALTLSVAGFEDGDIDVAHVLKLIEGKRELFQRVLRPRVGRCLEEKRYPARGLSALAAKLVDSMMKLDFPVDKEHLRLLSDDLAGLDDLDRRSLADMVNELKGRPRVHKCVRDRLDSDAVYALRRLYRSPELSIHLKGGKYAEVAKAMMKEIRARTEPESSTAP